MVPLHVDASVAYEGRDVVKPLPIDSCIADLVASLDADGYRMLSSCCGHGDPGLPGIEIVFANPPRVLGDSEVELEAA